MNMSLRTKIVIMPIIISVVGLGIVIYLAAQEVNLRTREQLQREALLTVSVFDADIENLEAVLDSVQVQDLIDKLAVERPEIVRFTFNAPVYEQAKIVDYRTLASSDHQMVGHLSNPEVIAPLIADEIELTTEEIEGEQLLRVIAPIHVDRKAVATVELLISLDRVRAETKRITRYSTLAALAAIALITIFLTTVLGQVVVRPISQLTASAHAMAAGDLLQEKVETALRETTHNLGERVKELNCLYGISGLVETPGITIDEILQGTVDLIPPAWQHPEITCARIILGEQEFKTENFAGSAWKVSADILVNGVKSGLVEVHYLDDMPDIDNGEGPFLREERSLINAIAERLGQIAERQRQADRMATLYQVGLVTNTSLDIEEVLVTIYEQCRQVMSADVFYIALYDEENEEVAYPIFFDHGQRIEPFHLPLDIGLGGWIIQNQRPFRCDDLVAEADHLPFKMHRTGGQQTCSYVGVPLMQREGVIGVLSAQSYQADAFDDADEQLLTTIAAQAAVAIENAQLYKALQADKERLEWQNKEIQEQKDLLDGLLKHAPFAIVINDMESNIRVVNPVFETLFGFAESEVVGQNLDEILSTPETAEEMRALSRKSLKEEQAAYAEGKRKRKDGTLIDVELFTTPYYIGNQQYGYMVFYKDISERLKAEAERDQTHETYRAVLDTLQDPYFEADKTGIITYMNLSFAKAVGYEVRSDVIGKHFRHFIHHSGIREVYKNFKVVYDTKRPAAPFEMRYLRLREDETVMIGDAYISPILEGDEVVGTRGIIRDMTERVRSEEALRVAKNEAETRAEELAAINRVATIVNKSLDLDEIFQSVCVELTKIFPVRNTGIALLDDDQTCLEVTAFHSIDPEEESALGIILPLEGNIASQEVLKNKKTVVIQDAQTDPRTKPIHDLSRTRGSRSFMIVPLLVRGKAIGTIGMPANDPEHVFTDDEIKLSETIASQIAAAVENARLYAQTEMALDVVEHDLEIGREIQSGFFPSVLPEIPGWEIAAHFQAARQVAGDFYDIFQFRNSNFSAFIIADVCDKGVGAALFMVLFRSLLRAFSEVEINASNAGEQLCGIILRANNFIAEIHGRSNMFATLFFGILDPDSGVLYYVNGGHEPPVIQDKEGNITQRLMPTGPAVGMFPDMNFRVEQIQFKKGDILVGFTDGATDAKNNSGQSFSEDRLLNHIQAPWTSVFSMVYDLRTQLQNHIGGQDQYDDITLVSFRRKLTPDIDHHAIRRLAQMNIIGELRGFAEATAIQCGLSLEDAFAFKLAAEEICTNIIQHGYEGGEHGFIAIDFECDKKVAKLTIQDDGKHFSPDQFETPDLEAEWEERKIGGLGLYIVKEIMDNVSYNKGRRYANRLVLEKILKPTNSQEEEE